MSQDNKKSFVMYQGDGSNNVFSVPMTKGKYGTISVAFVRRGLDQYEYNPDTWGLNGGLFAWDLSGTKVYTDTATPAIGATIYDQYGVDTGDTVTAVGGATITVNTNVYTRDTLHDVDENTVLTWTGDTLQVGDYIVIERTTTRTQPFEFQNNQKHIEKSDDNLERQIQEVADKVDNALLVDPTHTIDSNKMNPVEWMKTILRSVDRSVRGFRYLNGWLDYSLDDPNIADADKTWTHLVNTDNIKAVRERKETQDGEEHRWLEYLDENGQWRIIVDSNWGERIEEVESVVQTLDDNLDSHTADLNNPHATSMGNLTDTDIDAPTAGQFMKYDGSKWVNADSSATVSFGDIEGDPDDNTALAGALNDKADSSDVYTKNEIDTALNNKAGKATTLGGYNISDAYTKSEIDTALADKADSSDVYTKNEVDTALANKSDVATTYNKTEVDTIADGKADTDLSNITSDGKEVCANMAMPSETYDDLTVGASGSVYTAPADGWFFAQGNGTGSNMWIELISDIKQGVYGTIGWQYKVCLPVRKGSQCTLTYSNINFNFLRFVYANGAQ